MTGSVKQAVRKNVFNDIKYRGPLGRSVYAFGKRPPSCRKYTFIPDVIRKAQLIEHSERIIEAAIREPARLHFH
jgi:hypothetical protein